MNLIVYLSILSSFVYVIVSLKLPDKISKSKSKSQSLYSNKKKFIEAIIYENRDKSIGQSFSYKQSSTAFYDLGPIVDTFEDKQINLICVLGSWLLYHQPELAASALSEVKLLSSEDTKCSPPGMITLGSIQPIGPLSPVYTDSITLFKQESFAGEGVAVKKTTTSDKLKRMVSQVDSFIVTGRSKWTLVVDFSQTICVSVKTNKLAPICFVPYLENKPFNRIFEVREGCDSEKYGKYNGYLTLEECTNFGSGIIENIDLKKPLKIVQTSLGFLKLEGRGLGDYLAANSKMEPVGGKRLGRSMDGALESDGCKPPAEEADSLGEKRCTDMLDLRMNHGVEIMEKDLDLTLPTNPQNVWKTELLDHTVNVALATCPFEVVVPEYLKMAKELFLYLVNEVWEKQPAAEEGQTNSTVGDETWQMVVMQTKICSEQTKRTGRRFQEDVMMTYTMAKSPGDYSVPDIEALKLDRGKDTVIEYMWLVANHVAAVCHHAQDYVDDYLEAYKTAFHEMYLLPVKELWNNPGNTLMRCYNHVLGGYDMDSQYQRMRICTEKSLSLVNNLEPWDKSWMDETMWAKK